MKTNMKFRVLALTITWATFALLFPEIAEGIGWHGSPAYVSLDLFEEDTAIVETMFFLICFDDDTVGVESELENLPTEPLFASFDRDTEVTFKRVITGAQPGGQSWSVPVFIGKPGPGTTLNRIWHYASPVWEGGGNIVVRIGLIIDLQYVQPDVPRTVWTFINTSPYDIVDGVILMERQPLRYIHGLVIPAGGALTVEGQMTSGWTWTFGGILNNEEGSLVIAFDEASLSPEGQDISDVFPTVTYVETGFMPALLADPWYGGATVAGYGGIGGGAPNEGYISYFSPPADGEQNVFNLYGFTSGQQVGYGRADPWSENSDADGDGISNTVEGTDDRDKDGIPNYRDMDSDNDGLSDADEGTADLDGDGISNYLDMDSDWDGVSDRLEVIFGSDPYDPNSVPDLPLAAWPIALVLFGVGVLVMRQLEDKVGPTTFTKKYR